MRMGDSCQSGNDPEGGGLLSERVLGGAALEYVQSQLQQGWTLAQRLLELPLSSGRMTAYLPHDVGPRNTLDFDEGLFSREESGEAWARSLDLVRSHLSKPDRPYALTESFMNRGDSGLRPIRDSYFIFRSEVVFFLTSRETDPIRIRTFFRDARIYPFVVALTSLPAGMQEIEACDDPETCPDVDPTVLGAIAARTEKLLIGAWDDEGVIVWTRRDVASRTISNLVDG
jgi:hypothetical protein